MAFKVQASKYRHVGGKVVKKELWYPDLRINASASDVTMIEASNKFIAMNWQSPAATLAILPVEQVGKRKGDPYVINAHSGQLADFKFSPFDDGLLATGAVNDDASVNLWKVPEGGLTENTSQAFVSLSGHRRSVDTLAFHPSAANVLARYVEKGRRRRRGRNRVREGGEKRISTKEILGSFFMYKPKTYEGGGGGGGGGKGSGGLRWREGGGGGGFWKNN